MLVRSTKCKVSKRRNRAVGLWLGLFLVMTIAPMTATAQTEITFYGAWGAPYRLEVMAELVALFESENPDLRVNLVNIAGWEAVEERAQVSIAGGTPPDLLYMGETGGLTTFAHAGILTPLDSRVAADPAVDLSDFIPSVLELGRYNGNLYGIPIDSITTVHYHNLDLLGQVGVGAPSQTQDELVEVARKLTAATDTPVILRSPWNLRDFTKFLFPDGGSLFDERGSVPRFNDEAVQGAVDFLAEHWEGGLFGGFPGDAWFNGRVGVHSVVPIVVTNTRRVNQATFDATATLVPAGSHSRDNWAWGHYLAIPTASAKKDEAWRLIRFLLRHDVSTRWHLGMDFLPAQFSVFFDEPLYAQDVIWSTFVSQLQATQPVPVTPYWQDISRIWTEEIQPVFQRQQASGNALARVQERVEAYVNERGGSIFP